MSSARLLHRGEQFEFRDDDGRLYEGECVWSWEETPDGFLPQSRAYPIVLIVNSIHAVGDDGRQRRIDAASRQRIAAAARGLLEAQDPGSRVVVDDGSAP